MQPTETQPRYPIRIVVRRTGLSPHVLRAWERRYAAVQPGRDAGGGRLYSEADVARFSLLRRLTEAGHAIGRVARLPAEELEALAGPGESDPGAPPVHTGASAESDRFVAHALDALRELDAAGLHATLMRAVVTLTSRGFTEGVALPLLRRVGDLWERGEMSPAHEHVLSVQVEQVLGWLAHSLPVPAGAPDAVAVAPRGHRHEFGALLAAVAAAEEGWRVTYLGADLPASDIATAVRVRRAGVLLLSTVLRGGPGELLAELREIRAGVGNGVSIFVGGRGADTLRGEVAGAGATPLASLAQLRRELAHLHPGNGV